MSACLVLANIILFLFISKSKRILTEENHKYNKWFEGNSLLPHPSRLMAVGYDNVSDTIVLLGMKWSIDHHGNWVENAEQLISFNNETFQQHPKYNLTNNTVYGVSQFYTQIGNTLWTIENRFQERCSSVSSIRQFDLQTFKFKSSHTIPIDVYHYACLTATTIKNNYGNHTYLFVVGGFHHCYHGHMRILQIFNVTSETWMNQSNIPNMNDARSILTCNVHRNKLYAIGGYTYIDGVENPLRTIETLFVGNLQNLTNEKWKYIQNLSIRTQRSRSAIYGDDIIVIGGHILSNKVPPLDIIHVINSITDTVSIAGYLSYPVKDHSVIIVNHTVYVFGGVTNGYDGAIKKWQYMHLPSINASNNWTPANNVNSADLTIIISISIVTFIVIMLCAIIGYRITISSSKDINETINNENDISNALVVLIGIGDYTNPNTTLSDMDFNNANFENIPVQKDLHNIRQLFQMLKYKIIPNETDHRTENETCVNYRWTQDEIISFLQDDVGKELFDKNKELKYDGLIVFITCHGVENHIVTSDIKAIRKNVIHRIISFNNPAIRNIPRLFLFDTCDGGAERIVVQQEHAETESLLDKAKYIGLNDISTGKEWTLHNKNPDFKLIEIFAANSGYKAKYNQEFGSYLIHEFADKMTKNLMMGRNQTLGKIFDEIQNTLHDIGQQTTNIFNNRTRNIMLKVNKNGV